jgi:hypothetical protein
MKKPLQSSHLKHLEEIVKNSRGRRNPFKEPFFKPNFGDGHAKEEEGREERGEERRKEVAFHPQNAPPVSSFSLVKAC